MAELLRIKTHDYIFTIKTASVKNREQLLQKTLQARDKKSEPVTVKFNPPLALQEAPQQSFDARASILNVVAKSVTEIEILKPLFFENTQYQVEWVFLNGVEHAALQHRLQSLNEAFIFSPKEEGVNARLTGVINTGNDVGWMRLPLVYNIANKTKKQDVAFEVLPSKMLLHKDLPAMYRTIDQSFPLWRFSLLEKTEQDAGASKLRGNFPLMWLANFSQLRERFEQSLKVICQAPHSRLQPNASFVKAAKLKGRVPQKLAEKVKQDFASKQFDKRYRIEKKHLSVDTPENRFIKMVVNQSKRQLASFEKRLRASNQAPDKQRFSENFLQELHSWQKPLQQTLSQSFFKDVGDYTGLKKASLVLQQKTGYSAAYRIWQQLKFYLDVFSNQNSISMKSVAEIYEVWCFLCLKQILENDLGFELKENAKAQLSLNKIFEYQLQDGFAGAFTFKRSDGVTARLAHEPQFSKSGNNIRSYVVSQKPDIVLEVIVPTKNGSEPEQKFIWLFDAKYRIKTDQGRYDNDDVVNIDFVPDDAINQMHRYRDALIQLTTVGQSQQKSRPVVGAFALYPGCFNQQYDTNPYAHAINEVGIGAFALLPSSEPSGSGHAWVLDFLRAQIGEASHQYPAHNVSDNIYVQEAMRIPQFGMHQVRYPDLTLTASIGPQKGRKPEYLKGFEAGYAGWYHIKQEAVQQFEGRVGVHVAEEVRYLALALPSKMHVGTKEIKQVWPVKSVSLVPRYAISEQQSGKVSSSSDLFYLFELGRPLSLYEPVTHVPLRNFLDSMKLTTLVKLEKTSKFSAIEKVYNEISQVRKA